MRIEKQHASKTKRVSNSIYNYVLNIILGVWCDMPVPGLGQLLPGNLQSRYPHRARIQLTCRLGHRQRGDLTVHCQANSRWSRPDGACHS